MWTGGSVGGAVFDVELPRDTFRVGRRNWADAQRGFAVAKTQVVISRRPAVRRQPLVRDYRGRGEGDDDIEITQNASDKGSGGRRHSAGPVRVVGRGLSILIAKAHVDMHAVADAGRVGDGSEGGLLAVVASMR